MVKTCRETGRFATGPSAAERFWQKVDKRGSGECWEWRGQIARNGYGHFRESVERTVSAHRFSWFLHHGRAGDLHVLHTCDNKRCVNPAHLFLGTHQDNMRDRNTKGRQARGSGSSNAILTETDVDLIRMACETIPEVRQRDVAAAFGVNHRTVSAIMTGATWRHI